MVQTCDSFISWCNKRNTMVSPVYARNSGVSGSPWIALLNSFDVSGLFDRRCANGSARKFNPLPVVCVPPLMYLFGAFMIFSGIWKDTVLPASSATSTGCPGGLPASMTLTVCGTEAGNPPGQPVEVALE